MGRWQYHISHDSGWGQEEGYKCQYRPTELWRRWGCSWGNQAPPVPWRWTFALPGCSSQRIVSQVFLRRVFSVTANTRSGQHQKPQFFWHPTHTVPSKTKKEQRSSRIIFVWSTSHFGVTNRKNILFPWEKQTPARTNLSLEYSNGDTLFFSRGLEWHMIVVCLGANLIEMLAFF